MSETVSTDLLLRVARATPEQQAAIERILGDGDEAEGEQANWHQVAGPRGEAEATLMRIESKIDAVQKGLVEIKGRQLAGPDVRVSQREGERVFLLMQRLEGGPKQRKAPLGAVFRLLVLEGLSQRATAARCGCVESLISSRVAAIERGFGMSIERLRNFASELLSLETAAKGERRRRKSAGQPDDFDDREGSEAEVGAEEDEEAL